MRLFLSEKAARALKNLPPEDFVQCETHGKQRYARTPQKFVEGRGEWMCGECLREIVAKDRASEAEARKADDAAQEAKRNARKTARDNQARADAELTDSLMACEVVDHAMDDYQRTLAERRAQAAAAEERIALAEEQLRAAQRALDLAREELESARTGMAPLEQEIAQHQGQLDEALGRLKTALDASDEAWRGAPPAVKKKRNRRPRHAALDLLTKNGKVTRRPRRPGPNAEGEESIHDVDTDRTELPDQDRVEAIERDLPAEAAPDATGALEASDEAQPGA